MLETIVGSLINGAIYLFVLWLFYAYIFKPIAKKQGWL